MTLSHRYLNANLMILNSLGFPKAMAMECLDVDERALQASKERMCLDRFAAFVAHASDYTKNPNIALRMGHKFRVASFGQTGGVYSHCKTLADVIRLNNRYQKLAIDAGTVDSIKLANGNYRMFFRPYYEDVEKYRSITDIIMASYMTTYSWLTWGSGEGVLETHLPYARPKNIDAHDEIFRSDVVFNSPETFMEFSSVTGAHIITTHNPEKLTQERMKLDKVLGIEMESRAFERAVETALRGALDEGQVSSHLIAERMGLSWSVLRTRLQATGEGIRPRLDRTRKALFIEKYEAGESFAQIANALAYNDQPAMNRAFKRWFNMTPSQWRNAQAEKEP